MSKLSACALFLHVTTLALHVYQFRMLSFWHIRQSVSVVSWGGKKKTSVESVRNQAAGADSADSVLWVIIPEVVMKLSNVWHLELQTCHFCLSLRVDINVRRRKALGEVDVLWGFGEKQKELSFWKVSAGAATCSEKVQILCQCPIGLSGYEQIYS